MSKLALCPITQREACAFVAKYHRHHKPPRGSVMQLAAACDGAIVGVAIIGRPVSRMLDNGWTLEVLRLCTLDQPEARHAASMLYAAAWRAARALGYQRLITYTLASEAGTSVRAAGWRAVHQTRGGSWSREDRPRVDAHPLGAKTLWEIA